MADSLRDIPKVDFIDGMTLDALKAGLIERYQEKKEELTGYPVSLQPGEDAALILNACSVYLFQGFQFIQRSGEQNMLPTSYGAALENLAALRGQSRKDAQAATCTLRFSLFAARDSVVSIPKGSMASTAGQIYFATTEYAEIKAGDLFVDVLARCTITGESGNGYAPGAVSVMVDRIGYVETVSNTTATAGGSDIESDESLQEKTFLAPSGYSTAGPDDAYIYHSKAYNSEIDDVVVTSPTPGVVDVYITMKGGALPEQAIIDGLLDKLSDKNIRPLTDNVHVYAPETVGYKVNVKYWINRSDANKATTLQEDVEAAVRSYIEWQQSKIGRDINPDELIRQMIVAGAKRVEITEPVYAQIDATQIPAISEDHVVNYGGIEDD